jgi:hypothetical protein
MASLSMARMAFGTDFYVSPQGDDGNPGTLEQPFRTLERARDAVRALRGSNQGQVPVGGVTVWLRGGRYELRETFVLSPEDSGQEGRPVAYRAYAEERPVLSGGHVIRGWKKVEGNLPGLPEAAKGKTWAASLPEARDGKWHFRQLWADGRRLTRARWPNQGEFSFRVVDALVLPADVRREPNALQHWRQEVVRSWKTIEPLDPEVVRAFPGKGLPDDLGHGTAELCTRNSGGWATIRVPVEKAVGTQMTMAAPIGYLWHYWGSMHMMCGPTSTGHVENALSLLDQAGEWYLERKTGLLCYIPGQGENPDAEQFVAPKLRQLVCIRGTVRTPVSFVELRGLRLEHADWPLPSCGYRPMLGCYYGTQMTPLAVEPPVAPGSLRPKDKDPEYCLPAAVDLAYAENCLLELCRVGHVGASGIGLGEGCRHNRVLGCEVFHAGGNGIHAGLPHGPICAEDFAWNRPEDEPQTSEIANCYVHHNGQMDWGAYGIISSYCRGNRIAHNLVEQQPYSGICACFTMAAFPSQRDEDVTVEYNHVHHVVLTMGDAGGIYSKDGVSKSSAIRGNLIHDIGGNSPGNNGIFLDDGSYGFHLEDNMVHHVKVPVRFNRTSHERFTWGPNYFGVADAPSQWPASLYALPSRPPQTGTTFPHALAAKTGLEEPYKRLLLGKP